jgi:phospholipase A1/A2
LNVAPRVLRAIAPWLVLLPMTLLAGRPAGAEITDLLQDDCLLRELRAADESLTVGEIRARCDEGAAVPNRSLLLERMRGEQAAERVRSLLTAHRRNYLLPLTYVEQPNDLPFQDGNGQVDPQDELQNFEAKFQLSLKLRLASGLLFDDDSLYAGFSTLSLWQVYNTDVSAPFRENTYEPELFWATPIDWSTLGLDAGLLTLGLNHQSNGRGGSLSRSWNRIFASVTFEKDGLVMTARPWWRIPEGRKKDPLSSNGDDNPDIERFMGHFELSTVYRRREHELGLMLRNNLRADNKGAIQIDWSFPLWRGVRGYAQYFDGYGETLIDYDARIQRLGIGILLTDLL